MGIANLQVRLCRGAAAAVVAACLSAPAIPCAPAQYLNLSLQVGPAAFDPPASSLRIRGKVALGHHAGTGAGVTIQPDHEGGRDLFSSRKRDERILGFAAPGLGPGEDLFGGAAPTTGKIYHLSDAQQKVASAGVLPTGVNETFRPPADKSSATPRSQIRDMAGDREAILAELQDLHAYQPVFNGLKSMSGSWEERISAEGGARFFNHDQVLQTLSLIQSARSEFQSPNISRPEIANICARSRMTSRTSSGRRLLGLCALADCSLIEKSTWSRSSAELIASFHREAADYDGDEVMRGHDAVFLARAASYCGEDALALRLMRPIGKYLSTLVRISAACEQDACTHEEREAVNSARQVVAIVMLFTPLMRLRVPHLLNSATSMWKNYRELSSDIAEMETDDFIFARCKSVGIDSEKNCRSAYPYSFFLERKFLNFISDHPGQDPERGAAIFRTLFAREIDYRRVGDLWPKPIAGAEYAKED